MKKIIEAIKQNMLFLKILYYFLVKLNISNSRLSSLTFRNIAMHKLRKKYEKLPLKNYNKKEMIENNIIWFCWLQGLENAPQLVKICYESVINKNKNMNVIFIDCNNLNEYVKLPEYIINKWKNGIISNAHFSDLIRLELLNNYGGVWTDATTYYTDTIPEFVLKSDLFFFSEDNWGDVNCNMGNWFIASKSNNPILLLTRDYLFQYWKDYNIALDYFIFHLFFKIATEKYKDEYNKIPIFYQDNCHILMRESYKVYQKDRINQIKKMSFVHKLSYKYKLDTYEDTIYSKLLNGEEL